MHMEYINDEDLVRLAGSDNPLVPILRQIYDLHEQIAPLMDGIDPDHLTGMMGSIAAFDLIYHSFIDAMTMLLCNRHDIDAQFADVLRACDNSFATTVAAIMKECVPNRFVDDALLNTLIALLAEP